MYRSSKLIKKNGGKLQFGTEVVVSDDKTISTLLGASPGASTSVSIMIWLIERCFPQYSTKEKLSQLIPSYGIKLRDDKNKSKEIRERSHKVLGIDW